MVSKPVSVVVLQALRQLEGLPGARAALTAYLDIAGVWTIGYGHTGQVDGVDIGVGMTITAEKAEALLMLDTQLFADGVDVLVRVQLNVNQRNALILFAFNEGLGALQDSTLLRELNKGNYGAVPAQMARWVYAKNPKTGKKEVSNGLSARRATEAGMWLTPAHVDADVSTASAGPTHDSGAADAPPDVTSVAQTSTGKLQIGAIVTGGTAAVVQGYQQAQPIINAFQSVATQTATLPQWLRIGAIVCVGLSIAFAAFTLWDKHRKIKDPTI